MNRPHDAIVIGAGHNGLIAATFLAKAGLKTLVLERSDRVGGCAWLSRTASIDPAVIRALDLPRHGLEIVRSDVSACAPDVDGRPPLMLWRDPARAAQSIRAFSSRDAEAYPKFLASFARISEVLRRLASAPPPSIDGPSGGDLFELVRTGRRFRALGKPDAYRLLRWMPMAVADLAGEWFESEPLRASVAAGGILGSFLGPRSAGSAAVLLLLGAAEADPIATGWFAKGGAATLVDALAAAARAAGVDIRTGADVARIAVGSGTATGVALTSGEELQARAIVSGADPKRTFGLVDPIHLPPEFVRRVQNIRAHGTLATVTYTVSAPPRFTSLAALDPREQAAALAGRVRLGRDIDTIERAFDAAKYGGFSDEPWIELTACDSMVAAYVQYAPYHLRGTTWAAERERLGRVATRVIARYAPGFEASVLAQQVTTPLDLEATYGLTGGHIFHGELALDQLFVTRPLLGFARYEMPVRNLYICGSGTHPGTGLNGQSGMLAAKQIIHALRHKGA
jgi:phytoene dehydrogenase-like protein